MKKIYYLSTCNTCTRILKELDLPEAFQFQDIKNEALTEEQLEAMKALSGSYENLFNKRARQYNALNLKEKSLSEADYKSYLLEHYTFLKRPVLVIDDQIFIGNSKKTVEAAKQSLHQ